MYIVYHAENQEMPIYGLGDTIHAAWLDAAQWVDTEDREGAVAGNLPGFAAVECTDRLAAACDPMDVQPGWTIGDDGIADLVGV